jgi:large-conductance mechanosensitive channel
VTASAGLGWLLTAIAAFIGAWVVIIVIAFVILFVAVLLSERAYKKAEEKYQRDMEVLSKRNIIRSLPGSSMTTVLPPEKEGKR